MVKRKIRVLMSKIGMDYHNRGLLLVSRALSEVGMEVIILDAGQLPESVVKTAIQEDVDLLGISCMTAAHMERMRKVISLLEKADRKDIVVFLGGTIPKRDIPKLKEIGVAEVFGPGSDLSDIVTCVQRYATLINTAQGAG